MSNETVDSLGVKPLYRVVKVQRLGALSFHTFIDHWRKEGRLLAQLLWGTFALNVFALVIPLYMNAIYSRVIPAQADASLWVLSLGTLLAFGLEYLFRIERAKVMVGLSRSIRSDIEPQVVDQLVRAPLSRTTDWGIATLNGLTGWAKARSLFWSLAASSVLDLLFCVLFFAVIAIVAGWLVFGETITGGFAIAMVLVMAGLALVNLPRSGRAGPGREAPAGTARDASDRNSSPTCRS